MFGKEKTYPQEADQQIRGEASGEGESMRGVCQKIIVGLCPEKKPGKSVLGEGNAPPPKGGAGKLLHGTSQKKGCVTRSGKF